MYPEIETVINNLSKEQKPGPKDFTGEFYQTFREELILIFLKLFKTTAEEGTFPNSFNKITITLIPKPGKDNMKKENYKPIITDEHRCKNPQQNSRKQNSTTH